MQSFPRSLKRWLQIPETEALFNNIITMELVREPLENLFIVHIQLGFYLFIYRLLTVGFLLTQRKQNFLIIE